MKDRHAGRWAGLAARVIVDLAPSPPGGPGGAGPWVTHLRAAGIDAADLAEIAGHTIATATARYTHPLRRSDDAVRNVVG